MSCQLECGGFLALLTAVLAPMGVVDAVAFLGTVIFANSLSCGLLNFRSAPKKGAKRAKCRVVQETLEVTVRGFGWSMLQFRAF